MRLDLSCFHWQVLKSKVPIDVGVLNHVKAWEPFDENSPVFIHVVIS